MRYSPNNRRSFFYTSERVCICAVKLYTSKLYLERQRKYKVISVGVWLLNLNTKKV